MEAAEVPKEQEVDSGGLPERLNAGQIARLLGIKQPNVHKWLRRHNIEPVAQSPHPYGKLYDGAQVRAAREQWLADERRESDEKRRAAALAKQQD